MDVVQPWEVEQVRDRVGKRLTEYLALQRPVLDDISPDVGALVDHIGEFLDGGKRLRPMFLYWGWRAGGGGDTDAIITAAAAMEFLQACALIHDDVMDASDYRRGRPAMHRQFEQTHTQASWAGSGSAFGEGAAILVGDLCLSWADAMLFSADLDQESLRRAKPIYDLMRTELMAGQYLDLLEQARRSESVGAALRVATYKSAKYTIERPLQIGAVLAGAPDDVVDGLRRYGVALGQAFQLQDDLLGVFGDPAVTGKPAGDDLREGKRTALVALTLSQCTSDDRELLLGGLGDRDTTNETVARMTDIIASSGARKQVETLIQEQVAVAAASIEHLPIPGLARQVLSQLIAAATDRIA